ncbi:uncharacterized protein susd3 isoform 2-T2 [Aulostomus maculatus]
MAPNGTCHSQAQCTPVPLPALGTQRIIQGNGTDVGTVISLQCPAKHKLIGSELMCVTDTNSTHWVGETYCKPLSPYEEYGFRVAVLASIASSAIILFMSLAFITCCVLDSIKEDKRKKQERESAMWQWQEQARHQDHRSHFIHSGRNNNNNNSQEKMLSLWDTHNPLLCDNIPVCRCHLQYAYGPVCTYDPTPPHSALPGLSYVQPLIPPDCAQISGPPQYFRATPSSCQTMSPGLVQISALGPSSVWQYGGQQSSLSEMNADDESHARNINSDKDFSIRIISV